MRGWVCASVCWLALASPAPAAGLTDWALSPSEADLAGWTASLGGLGGASLYAGAQPGRPQAGASLSGQLFPHIQRVLDNGWEIGLRGAVLAYHDHLAGDVYGDRTIEKAYLFAQTPYGRFEAGEDDGAAYRLSVTGPSVDDAIAVDNAATTFFRDPQTGRALIDMFRLASAEFASSNDAKFTYVATRWFGIQLAGSYTPNDAHGGLPFVSRGSGGFDRQTNLFEGAANYVGVLGALSYSFSAGLALGRDSHRTAGHADLKDGSIGGEADYTVEGIRFALGGAYRESNAYALDISDARASGETRSWRMSGTATTGPWIAGLEYAGGATDDALPQPGVREHGLEASLGYVVNSNLQLTGGWQQLAFHRDTGTFFNGAPSLGLNAEFLHLKLHV